MAEPSITSLSIATGCIRALVVAFQANAEDWGGALEAGGLGGITLLSQIVRKRLKDQDKSCSQEAQVIAQSLEKQIDAENLPDKQAILANLSQFAPELFTITRVTPHDLANWDGDQSLSNGQRCLEITLSKILSLIHISEPTRPY